jgi:hypothetical protein
MKKMSTDSTRSMKKRVINRFATYLATEPNINVHWVRS